MPFFGRRGSRPRYSGPRMFLGGRSRRTSRGSREHITRNRFELTVGPTTGGVEFQLPIVACVEAPGDRSVSVPAGALVKSIIVDVRATQDVDGKHQALMVYRPGAENLAVPIASYLDITDPLTEEGVKMRRLAMSRLQTQLIGGTSITPPRFRFRWKGAKRVYDGDDISIWFLDAVATTYDAQIWTLFSQ